MKGVDGRSKNVPALGDWAEPVILPLAVAACGGSHNGDEIAGENNPPAGNYYVTIVSNYNTGALTIDM